MTKFPALALAALVAITAIAGSLSAQPPLKDVQRVRDGIIHVGMAYEISEKCSSIRARTWRGINFLQSLKNHAEELGYSDAQIDAYINDDAEKDRLEGIARRELARLGIVEGDESTYCAVGRSQIAANTRVGWLLR
ncbi:DUF5333 domain-containing protein [Cognatiyoonia sp. IB215182]|uniref:DUF5333 domain-containing protein n=1 Tax=Cognatiyoonia sp. IB215182 TaxID=3097353 RepID=UPI002A0FD927|nr:DUF5333 domain-containing protein [Cognatiyoonia sp. IB215182]MDX8352325.1 DUF5333 domain-containing protein [Cognatiyoonia sp. IB215182]